MSSPSAKSPYAGYRFPPEVISHAVWLYFRFPLSLRMVEGHRQLVQLRSQRYTRLGLSILTATPQRPHR